MRGRKQSITHEAFTETTARIDQVVSCRELDDLVARTVCEVRSFVAGKRAVPILESA